MLPLGSKCDTNIRHAVGQLPRVIRNNPLMLEKTISSLEDLGNIHPKLVYLRIQYLNSKYSGSISSEDEEKLSSQFSATRNKEIEKKYNWLNYQISMLEDSTSFFEYLRLKKYLNMIDDKPITTQNDTIELKYSDVNGISYFMYLNEIGDRGESFDQFKNYYTLVQENRKRLFSQYQDWSKEIKEGSLPVGENEFLKLLDYWYLFQNDGTLSERSDTPIFILIRDYFRILLARDSNFSFSLYPSLVEKRLPLQGTVITNRIQYTGKRIKESVETPKYMIDLGYSGTLIAHSNILSMYTINVGATIPEKYQDKNYDITYQHEFTADGVPVLLEELTYPVLKFSSINASDTYGSLTLSLWNPIPSLSLNVGYLLYSELREYNFEYAAEYSIFLISNDGTRELDRVETDEAVVEKYSERKSTGYVIYGVNYRINKWLTMAGEYYHEKPYFKIMLTL